MARVIGAEHIIDASDRGRLNFEVFPGDIVTALAQDTAARLGIKLLEGPELKPEPIKTDGNTSLRRILYKRSPKWVAPRRKQSSKAKRFGKLALVGAGGVGFNIAHLSANSSLAEEISLIDITPGVAPGIALDLNHTSGITGSITKVSGGESLDGISGADVVVVTAGRPRMPGMKRSDLIDVNKRVIHSVAEAVRVQAQNSIVIVVTNPLDEMTLEMLRATGFPRERVIGMAGTLDSCRFRFSLASAAGVSPSDVTGITLGSHGDEMAPITSLARIKGQVLEKFLSKNQIEDCIKDAVTGGGQVVEIKKTGSAVLAPAHATLELLNHIRGALSGPVPASVMLSGEFGLKDVVLGVPIHLNRQGLVNVEEIKLSQNEHNLLMTAAGAIRSRLGLEK